MCKAEGKKRALMTHRLQGSWCGNSTPLVTSSLCFTVVTALIGNAYKVSFISQHFTPAPERIKSSSEQWRGFRILSGKVLLRHCSGSPKPDKNLSLETLSSYEIPLAEWFSLAWEVRCALAPCKQRASLISSTPPPYPALPWLTSQ